MSDMEDPIPRAPARATSVAALKRRSPRNQARILETLRVRGAEGATYHELSAATGIPTQSATSAIRVLFLAAHLKDSGRTRPGPYRRECTVWEIA